MSKHIINQVVTFYTPASRSEDGMTETVAHFCAACSIGDNPIGLAAFGRTEDDARCNLCHKYAEAINAGKVPGVVTENSYEIEIGRITRTGYPEDVLQKELSDEHRAAIHMNEAIDRDARRKMAEDYYETGKEHHLAGIDLTGVSMSLEYDDYAIKVWGLSEYNPHTRRSESVIATKRFPRGRIGGWNWIKIREHVQRISNHLTAKRSGLAAQDAVRKQVEEMAQRLGFDKYTSAWEAKQENVHLNVYVPVEKFEEVVLAIRALGITLK